MSIRIITISRQFGSGGHTVGQLIAEKLGLPLYDNELVTKIAEKSGFDVSFVKENSEKVFTAMGMSYYMGFQNPAAYTPLSLYDQLYIAQHNIIRELAEKEECVIIGRCADYILEDRDDTLRTFIYADNDYRAKRIIESYGDNGVKVEKRIKDKDNGRSAYYRHYTNREWGDPANYHMCLNSGFIGIEQCADLIVQAVRSK
ncbi:MAG: cytidylate kinase-like family protein [Ruminococcaceae bacterium]|jgi:cytidylate kinase|nr:cytidylate kinase-like family protein [Oscillospiraceae bacterium]